MWYWENSKTARTLWKHFLPSQCFAQLSLQYMWHHITQQDGSACIHHPKSSFFSIHRFLTVNIYLPRVIDVSHCRKFGAKIYTGFLSILPSSKILTTWNSYPSQSHPPSLPWFLPQMSIKSGSFNPDPNTQASRSSALPILPSRQSF